MLIVSPARYQPRTQARKRTPYFRAFLVLVLLAGLINYVRPLPQPTLYVSITTPKDAARPALAWPSTGQAAVAAEGYGLLGTSGQQQPIATASIAKVITALCVLQKAPLGPGQTGPTYTIGPNDVAIYQDYVDVGGSVLAVQKGETLNEYQALQALMIPSANNIADSMANWVFGSHTAYADYATNFLQRHGLNQTHVGTDASGFDPSTQSTANDLAQIGLLALKNQTLMQIAGQDSAYFPISGTLPNYNTILGQQGITGLKTGNSDEDPGAFLFTSHTQVNGQDVLLTGAVLGMSDLDSALQATLHLNTSLQQGFQHVRIVSRNQSVGRMQTVWGASSAIIAGSDVQLVRWEGSPVTEDHTLDRHARSGKVGSLRVEASPISARTELDLQHAIPGPSFWWRLTRH